MRSIDGGRIGLIKELRIKHLGWGNGIGETGVGWLAQ